ncbi:MAG: hypothetical protein VYE18_07360 [Pseudomonadota bacterium]|nr:hypothetical protein [Pseudomonadota bacterium]
MQLGQIRVALGRTARKYIVLIDDVMTTAAGNPNVATLVRMMPAEED